MSTLQEFHYRLPGRASGWRPGSHRSHSLGGGQEFVTHARLFDHADPRRLDLRASLRSIDGEWLVRAMRQRAALAVHAIVDVSASMGFGAPRTKLDYAADFVEALGTSAFRIGDAAGMFAFDGTEREDLFFPAVRSRGIGVEMAAALRRGAGGAGSIDALLRVCGHLAGRGGLVFLLSDFHWPLARLGDVLDTLAPAYVVPILTWDAAEMQPPAADGIAPLRDAETGMQRTVWMRPALRARWRDAIAQRRAELDRIFTSRGLRPFLGSGRFDPDALSQYFLEVSA